jgi:hypothetical protein
VDNLVGMVGCNDLILLVDNPSVVIIYLLINLISEHKSLYQCQWYFEPYGILTPGPNFIHGKLNPHGILNSLISNQDIGKGFDLPWVGGSKYNGHGVRYTMGRRSKVH